MRWTLRGAHLVETGMDLAEGEITINGTLIEQLGQHDARPDKVIDVGQAIITPGFIDVHTHGGGGFELHTTDADQIRAYGSWVPATGVTAFLAGVVGTPDSIPIAPLQAAVDATEKRGEGAEMLGIHLEGPYISAQRRGAHSLNWLRQPDIAEIEQILKLTSDHLRLVTVAPELPGAHEMIRHLVKAGVTVSIGHTDAHFEEAEAAIALGITHATHCFNAMRPLLHRAPGPLAAIAKAPQVQGEIIADGVHVHPEVVRLLVKMLGVQRVVVVTDALAVAGLEMNNGFVFAGREARITCGAAHLGDGTLAGSVLTMEQAFRNVLTMTHISLSEAVGMLTYNPARAAHVEARKGRLQPGYDADLLIFDAALKLQATICQGQIAYARDPWNDLLRIY